MNSFVLVSLFFTSFLAGVTNASESSDPSGVIWSGRVFSDVYAPYQDLNHSEFRQSSVSLWLQGDHKLPPHSSARWILTGDAFDKSVNSAVNGQFRVGLREGYAQYSSSGFVTRLGRQLIPWGNADAVNPTDFLSAKDYQFFNPDDEVRRIASNSAWFNFTPSKGTSPFNFTFVWTPVFPQSKLRVTSNALPSGVTLQQTPHTPPAHIQDSEIALKSAYAGQGFDASLSFFRGWSHLPELAGSLTDLYFTFHRIRGYGADTSISFDKWVVRFEGAYMQTENDNGKNPLIQPSHFDAVAGVERPFFDDFRVQLQGIYRYHPQYTKPEDAVWRSILETAVNREIAKANALLLGYQYQTRTGASFRVSYLKDSSGLESELFVLGNFVGEDYLVRPKVSYAWTDAFKTTLGLEYYGGPENRPLGALKSDRSIFLEGKYSF